MAELLRLDDYRADWETFDRNEARDHRGVPGEPCLLCGRHLTETAIRNGWSIEITTGGQIIPNDHHVDLDSQGCFPIGSECAKKIPRTHRAKSGRS